VLFFERNPLSLRPVNLTTDWERCQKGSYIFENRRAFQADAEGSPLMHRVWAVQEPALAMRVLQFTSHQIYWECVTHSASEAHPEGLSQVGYPLEKDWSRQDFKKTRHFKKNYDHSEFESEIYSIWSNILYYYTWAKPQSRQSRATSLLRYPYG
jgi:hypothetical protein